MSVLKRTWTTKTGEKREAWRVDWFVDGKREFQTFERKKDADDFYATVRVDIRKGLHVAPSKTPTVAEAAESWIKRVEADGREATTIKQYRQHIDLHIVPRIGRFKLAQLAPAKIEAFRDDLLAHISRPLARKVLTSFKSLLKGANHAHLITGVSIGRDQRSQRKLEVG